MTQLKPNPVFRLMPSLTDVAFLMPLAFLFARMGGVRGMLGDGDTGWHVRTGEWILAHGQVPRVDIFSYTRPGEPWFAWEWLWDVGAAILHQRWGMAGVVLMSMAVLGLTFALLFRLVNRRSGNPVVAIGFTILAMGASTVHWLARPHLFTLLFAIIFLEIVERVREGRTGLLWYLPVLTVLWANMHGGFLAGVLVLLAYGAGSALNGLLASEDSDRAQSISSALRYFAAAAGCLAASLINPYGYQLHVHIWEYLRDPYAMEHIAEFQSANFHHPTALFFEVMLAAGLASAVWFASRRRYADAILLAGWAHLSLTSVRNAPLFAIVAAPVAAEAAVAWLAMLREGTLARWVRRAAAAIESASAEFAPVDGLWRVHAVSAAALAVVGLAMANPAAGAKFKPEYNPQAYPAAALPLLDSSQRIFTNDEWGDYLIYQTAARGGKVFIDGRSDFYGRKFNEQYIELMAVKYDWDQTLTRYGVDTVILPPTEALASALKLSRRWRVVYDDGSTILFRLAGPLAAIGPQVSTSSIGGRAPDLRVTDSLSGIPRNPQSQPGGHSTL